MHITRHERVEGRPHREPRRPAPQLRDLGPASPGRPHPPPGL